MELKEKVKTVVAKSVGHSDFKTSDDFDDIGLDSVDKLEVVLNTEKEFIILIPNDKIENITNTDILTKYVENYTPIKVKL